MNPEHRDQRIDYLDGLRGLAVIGVLIWHYTDEVYSSLLPYGSEFASIPMIDRGWVGVNLFFLISGFVILLTLERCTRYRDFIKRRWLRLFPAMLIASLIVFTASQFNAAHMPHGQANLIDVLPGLTFISVGFYNELLPIPVSELDGVYWTLYVEAGFYVVYGALFFAMGWRRALAYFTALWIFTLVGSDLAALTDWPIIQKPFLYLQWVGAEYFGWFVSGALFYKANLLDSDRLFALAIAAGIVSALTSGLWQPDDLVSQLYLVGCVGLFAMAQRLNGLQRLLAVKPLLFLGFVSYPLYLLHNEFGIGLISAWGETLGSQVSWTITMLVTGLVILLAYIVTKWIEPEIKTGLKRVIP